MRNQVCRLLTDPRSKHYFLVSDLLAFFTILSVLSLVLETVPNLADYAPVFSLVEWAAVTVFSIEYLARLWVTEPRRKYVLSFFGIIDLVSVLPTILGLGNLTFLKSARAVRIIRLLRMVRLAKVSRQSATHADIEESIGVVGLNIVIYTVLLLVMVLVFGTALYVVEETLAAFASIPAAMWWTLKVFVGSIPVDAPLSALGAVLYVLARFTGLILLGVLIGVVGNIIRHLLTGTTK